jgi:hypothetical protein
LKRTAGLSVPRWKSPRPNLHRITAFAQNFTFAILRDAITPASELVDAAMEMVPLRWKWFQLFQPMGGVRASS